ncbi:MAG TPA: hydroxyethylthiazole kinase [Sporosarcina sp.]|nr:hydroxyethylthiazole kinase [Sporosarcina sp.]
MNKKTIQDLFAQVKAQKPLVHHITNAVTINDCANVTLAIGGSPVMATSIEEVEEMVSLAGALVVNIGTIQTPTVDSMLVAGKAANAKNIPVVFDPVGVGATSFRTEKAKQFLAEVHVAIIRGNASEIGALIDGDVQTRGVDAGDVTNKDKHMLAMRVAQQYKTVVVMSGKEDVICDGVKTVVIDNGDVWLPHITGTGCMSTSLIANFASVTSSMFDAAIAGMSTMGIAGEYAKEQLREEDGIGTFRMKIMDRLFVMTGEQWATKIRMYERSIDVV